MPEHRVSPSSRIAGWLSPATRNSIIGVQWGDALQILERSGVIAQAELTKIHRQRIPELRAAIEDLSKGRTGEGFDKLDNSEPFKRSRTTPNAWERLPRSKLKP